MLLGSTGFDLSAMKVLPLTTTIGAEIRGLDLASELDDATVSAVRHALLEHLVVFFRDQDITADQQLRFSRRQCRMLSRCWTSSSISENRSVAL
jgi:alpha-ketoglutarate-dependent taurine dioxygenase